MTTNNKHLVDSGREFAAKIDIHTAIIDIVRKMADLTKALAAEIKRSEALVAENAGLKECAVNYVHAVALWNSWADAEDKISPVLETPATDAFLAEVRAQARREGVNFAAARLAAAFNHGFIDKPTAEVYDVVKAVLGAKEELATAPDDGLSGEYAEQALNDWAIQLRREKTA